MMRPMRWVPSRSAVALVALAGLSMSSAGCRARVGNDCPPAAAALARSVVYRRDGLPAYAGQALMITSCGGGAFCHSSGATGADRYGAPHDLDFDPELADQLADPTTGAAHLRASQIAIYANRDDIYDTVVRGTMPPGAAGARVQQPLYGTFDDAGTLDEMAGLATPEGRETLRNWLACGAPMIERTGGLGSATACSSDADCVLTGACDLAHRTCLPVGDTQPYLVVPVQPTWSSLYEVVVQTRCAQSSCHGASAAGGLDLSDRDTARATLLSGSAHPLFGCAGEGAFIVPGDAAGSLFYRKLNDPTVCGGLMPRGGGQLASRYLDAFRDWIDAGAPP